MKAKRIVLSHWRRRKLKQEAKWALDARYRTRCLIVLRADEDHSNPAIAAMLSCSKSLVSKTLARFEQEGLAGLVDRREDNGRPKADESYIAQVREVLKQRTSAFGH